MPHDILQNHSASFTSKSWIWGFLKHRNPKTIVLSHWSKAMTWMILGSTGTPPFQIPPTIPPLPERLPSHDRRPETNARLHPHRHAQNRRCPSWYAQQHSWRELGVLHISMKFTWYVVSFLMIPMPQQKQKSRLWPVFVGLYFYVSIFLGVAILYLLFLWTSAMFYPLVKLSACIETVWILKCHRFWCSSLASQLASSKLEIKTTRKSRKSLKIFPDPSQFCKKQKIEILSILASGLTSSRLYCVGTRGCCTSFPAIPTRA